MKRRGHRKSRNGCIECKRRHAKCDETKPVCSNCRITERICSYPVLSGAQSRVHRSHTPTRNLGSRANSSAEDNTIKATASELGLERQPPTSSPTASSVSLAHRDSQSPGSSSNDIVNSTHIELILHFSSPVAIPELSTELIAGATELFIQKSLASPFLLHQVLAISARHLASLQPERFNFYFREAVKLQNKGIALFNDLDAAKRSDDVATMIYSSILGRHSLADALATRDCDFTTFITGFVHSAQLQRGVRTVFRLTMPSLFDSEFAPFLKWGMSTADASPQGHECDVLRRLLSMTAGLDPVSKESCRSAIHFLQLGLDQVSRPVISTNPYQMIFTWNIIANEEFIALLKELRPEALAILGWYAVLLHHGRHLWQVGDAGAFVLQQVADFLGTEWAHWLEWPRSIIFALD